jgi:uncharacterized Fe-S radical SAM superfamily protein PflX
MLLPINIGRTNKYYQMKNLYYIVLLITVLTFSCQNKNKYILTEEKFVDILVDIHIADAFYSNNQYGKYKLSEIDSAVYYKVIFEKYNIEKERFDSTLSTYTKQPELMVSIYDQVIDKLKKIETEELRKEEESLEE